ncbi:hypothetical protein VP1G_00735 [Cytospora mali]|uniref:2EXR domain-containing protein n=1 Tax=Cytospora mali TaxID=578113 RepID=A0A194UNY9_CYTMA|nr:hypothetical protein VP1G_00735 [Valsa mali var. pyri (nom. inval.)]
MSSAMDATTPSFTYFPKLVIDLRLIIWEMALPADVQGVCVFSGHSHWVRNNEQLEVMISFPQIAHVCSESRSEALRHVMIHDVETSYQRPSSLRAAYRPFRPDLDIMLIDPKECFIATNYVLSETAC